MPRIALLSVMLALLACFAQPCLAQSGPRVLVLIEADSRLPLSANVLAGMEEVLSEDFMTRGDTYVEFLDMFRFTSPEQQNSLRNLLVLRHGTAPLDAVVVLGPNALRFALANRTELAPGAPIVFAAIAQRSFAYIPAAENVTGAFNGYDPVATVALARRLQPEARDLVIVTGAGGFDRQWHTAATELFGNQYEGMAVRYLDGPTIGALHAEVAKLDPSAIVLMLTFTQDATGLRFIPREAVRSVSEVSAAPIYGVYDTYLGYGIVGGVVDDSGETGRSIDRSVRLILDGKTPPQNMTIAPYPAVDWNELQC